MLNNEFAIGTISSIISYSLTYPIDAIKTNYQVANLNQKPILKDVIKQIYITHGIRGFYRGISSNLLTYPLFWGIFFQTNSHSNVFIASGIASLVTNPLFVLKTRFQSLGHSDNLVNQKVSYFNLTKNIYKNEGPRGFFKGFGSTLANNTKLWIQMPLYDKLYEKTNNIVMASMIAKIASATLYYPTDLIRTNQRNLKDNRNVFELSKSIYRTNGIKGFYNGVMLYNLVSIPSFVTLMVCRDYIKKYYDNKNKK
jgi:solute carrier family 25 (mitochondrial folate transporter), member 32